MYERQQWFIIAPLVRHSIVSLYCITADTESSRFLITDKQNKFSKHFEHTLCNNKYQSSELYSEEIRLLTLSHLFTLTEQ